MNPLEVRLAKHVRRYRHLYDRSSRDYKDSKIAAITWREISEKLGVDDHFLCRNSWKNLRDKFVKAKARMNRKSGDGGGNIKVPKLYTQLSWMDPFVQREEPLYYKPSPEPSQKDAFNPTEEPTVFTLSSTPPFDVEYRIPSADDCGSSTSSLAPSSSASQPDQWRKGKCQGTLEESDLDTILDLLDKRRAEREDTDDFDRYVQHIADFMRRLPPKHCCTFKFQLQRLMFETEQSLLTREQRGDGDGDESGEFWRKSFIKVKVP